MYHCAISETLILKWAIDVTALPQTGLPHQLDQASEVVIARHVAAVMGSGADAGDVQVQAREVASARGTRSILRRIGGAVIRDTYQILSVWRTTRSGAAHKMLSVSVATFDGLHNRI